MKMTATRENAAPTAYVWRALSGGLPLRAGVPRCQEMTGTTIKGAFTTLVQRVGRLKATFVGTAPRFHVETKPYDGLAQPGALIIHAAARQLADVGFASFAWFQKAIEGSPEAGTAILGAGQAKSTFSFQSLGRTSSDV